MCTDAGYRHIWAWPSPESGAIVSSDDAVPTPTGPRSDPNSCTVARALPFVRTPGLAEQQLEVLELAHERVVLALELLVGLSGRLEHREGEGAAAVGQRHDPGREELERLLVGAGEHVDHPRFAVGANL